MSHTVSRRAVTRGAAWSVPAVAVAAAAPALAASRTLTITTDPAVAYVGESYTALVSSTGTGPFAYTAVGLPNGMIINPTDGTISGTPSTAGSFPVTINVTDSTGAKGSQTVTIAVGVNRAQAAAQMLADINARRASIGVAPLTMESNKVTIATNWADHLAADVHSLVHQNPLPAGVMGENLSATCSSSFPTDSAASTGDQLTSGWLNEPHTYAEFLDLKNKAETEAEAWEMFYGDEVVLAPDGISYVPKLDANGQAIPSTKYPVASGHRINLENPNFTSVGLAAALTTTGSACGGTYQYGYFGAAEFA